ncbi:glycosyltransferase [Georgenia phoenicis]|uniref:glycosyltransferase n=1 Tax=unclassified Georgenia TaxID=2626815 RepID=UPI0039AFA69C
MSATDAGAATTLAVVVSPGVSPYLPRTLRGLAEQTRPVGTVLLVDTSAPGREVGTGVPVHAAIDAAGLREVSTVRVLQVPAPRSFGAAVRAALAQYGTDDAPEWLWLLHDDSAPEPRAHAELLRAGESGPSVAVAGPKQRDWARPDLLLEAGVQATSTGRRVPDIEDGEIDQGQHDSREDVLAVGTAGALVRRSVWDELGGPDPALGPFGDGLDLSQRAWLAGHRVVVVPGAVVHHARASYQGLRDLSSPRPDPQTVPDARRSFAARRRAQLFLWLTSTPWYWVPLVALAILALAPVRALWRVATKEIGLVGAEMRAAAEVLARPAAVWRARRRHRATRRVPLRYLRPLRASWSDVTRAKRDERRSQAAGRAHRVAPSELEMRERAVLARRRRGTLGLVLLGLTTVALVALGPLLTAGALRGGALAPLDAAARELWQAATSAWLPAGLGHAGPADPLLTVLAVAALPLAGASGNVLTTAVLVLAVPLAGLGAWFASGAATRSVLLRAWAAVVWALAPALLVGVGHGRLGAVLAHVVLPWAALGVARAVGVNRRDVILSGLVDAKRVSDDDEDAEAEAQVPAAAAPVAPPATGSISAAAGGGLALAVACAGAPALLPAALLLLLVLALVVPRRRRLLALVAVPPVLLLGPLLTVALGSLPEGGWRVLLADPGVPLAADPGASWLAALGWPLALSGLTSLGGPWPTVLALAGGVAVAVVAVLALLRGTARARAVRAGWLAVVVGLATAVLSTRTPVAVGTDLAGEAQLVHGWAGAGTSLALLGMLVAATSAGDGLRDWLSARSFGWRHLTVGAVALVMVLGPLATAGAWLTTVVEQRGDGGGELLAIEGRQDPSVPALARELQTGAERSRVLALHADGDRVRPEVWRHAGPQLSETSAIVAVRGLTPGGHPAEPDDATAELQELVAELATGTADAAGEQLGRLAVGVVLVPPLADADSVTTRQDLIARLDATAGLERVTENASGVIWRTSRSAETAGAAQAVSRARVVSAEGEVLDTPAARPVGVGGRVAAGEEGRLLVLAERADPAWRATYNGRPLRATTDGWRQAFELPAHTGRLEISYEPAWLTPWRVAQAVGLGLVVLLAVPVRRRREETT